MAKKLIMFVSAAVLSFGMSLAAEEVVVVNQAESQEFATVLHEVEKLNAEGVTNEEILASVCEAEGIEANNIADLMTALTAQRDALTAENFIPNAGTTLGNVTLGMVLAGVVAYIILPAIWARTAVPACKRLSEALKKKQA